MPDECRDRRLARPVIMVVQVFDRSIHPALSMTYDRQRGIHRVALPPVKMSVWDAIGRWAGWLQCMLCRLMLVILCSERAVCAVQPCGVLRKLLLCAELTVCAYSRRRGPFGGKRARLAVHQTCSASPRKLLRSRNDPFCHAACLLARRLKC